MPIIISRRKFAASAWCALAATALRAAPANSWNKIRYQGGTVEVAVNPFDWNTTLTVAPGQIELLFAGRTRLVVPNADLAVISYGQKAYRRVADLAVLSVVATPVVLFGLLHKSKDHMVSLEYKTPAGKTGAVLLMVHKDHYRDMLEILRKVTGKPVENWP